MPYGMQECYHSRINESIYDEDEELWCGITDFGYSEDATHRANYAIESKC